MEHGIILKLFSCFPNSTINYNGEFIAEVKTNQYFNLQSCSTEKDVQCKVLEWLSRSACKTEPYRSEKKNNELHKFMRDGINQFLGTDFSEEDMEKIYTHLGNAVNRMKTVAFIDSGYDMKVLEEE